MAKQKSFVKFRGTIDDLTFYRTADGDLVRKAGGIDKDRILNSPDFRRTRENMNEFKTTAATAKYLRTALSEPLKKVKDIKLGRRLFKVFTQCKVLDSISPRGSRKAALGVGTPEGQALLKGFDFNSRAAFTSVIQAQCTTDIATGKVEIPDFNPDTQMESPEGATHASFSAVLAVVDFSSGGYGITQSEATVLAIDAPKDTLTLMPATIPEGSGFMLLLLLVEFFQEVNGVQYALRNGGYNVLRLMDIAPTD